MSEIPPPTVPPATPPPPGGGSYTPPPPPPNYGGGPVGGGPASSDRTLMVVLSYLWILVLIPLLTKKDDPEVQWHAKNGLGITIAEILAWLIAIVIGYFAPTVIGCLATSINCIVGVGFFVIRVIAVIKGINGQRFTIPVLSDLGKNINI
jgi:uncharacterized membrane protein